VILEGLVVSFAGGLAANATPTVAKSIRRNGQRIADRASLILGGDAQLNERTTWLVVREGAFAADPIVTDYLGGIVAEASLTGHELLFEVSQIARLSARQLKRHYLIYEAISSNAQQLDATK